MSTPSSSTNRPSAQDDGLWGIRAFLRFIGVHLEDFTADEEFEM